MEHRYERILKRMEEDLQLAGYSERTVSSYRGAASQFLRHTGKPARQVTGEDVRRYFLFLAEQKARAGPAPERTMRLSMNGDSLSAPILTCRCQEEESE